MSPAIPYKNTEQDAHTQGKTAWQDKLKDARATNYTYLELTTTMKITARHSTRLMACYLMEQKDQAAMQGPTSRENRDNLTTPKYTKRQTNMNQRALP